MTTAAETAQQWLDAVTARDREELLALSDEAIRIYGPDGVGVGHGVLEAWFDAMPMRIEVKSIVDKGQRLLVEHHIDWLDAEGNAEYSIDNAAWIEVAEGKVVSYRRADDSAPGEAGTGDTAAGHAAEHRP